MATEYKLSFTADEINEKLGKIDDFQADWNTLKNRPFFARYGGSMIVCMQIAPMFNSMSNGLNVWNSTGFKIVNGATYTVMWGSDRVFTCTAAEIALGENTVIILGNLSIVGMPGGSNEPFVFGYDPNDDSVICYTEESTVSRIVIVQDDKLDIILDKEYVLSPNGKCVACVTTDFHLEPDKTYGVVWDGVTYICDTHYANFCTIIGDYRAMSSLPDAEIPFYISSNNPPLSEETTIYAVGTEATTHTVSVYVVAEKVIEIPEKYLPKKAIEAMIDAYTEEALGGKY